ncbi:epoxide hydrolase family protein [Williamsia sp. M5A3_1d]
MTPFTIDVSDDDLADLRRRLDATRWPEAETVDDWSQGIPLSYTRDLAAYWAHDYDWRSRETALNRFDQFTTDIDGLRIHFIHQRSPHPGALPLLITHGWPGSVVEFHKVIDALTDPTNHGGRAEDAFHVICPSLPGFGFSGTPTEAGWGVERTAAAWETLMGRLGYSDYVAQGGDWGAGVTTQIGRNRGRCIAIHTTNPIHTRPDPDATLTAREQDAVDADRSFTGDDSAYSALQTTRPQTVGYGLVDSPVAQLAWIVEKFRSWMDCDGHPENVLSRDELLDNVMLYWVNSAGASSARLYWESMRTAFLPGDPVLLPTGVAIYPTEIYRPTREWCEPFYDITHWREMPRGGHFAAFEQPDIWVADIREFFATVRPPARDPKNAGETTWKDVLA